MCRPTNTIERRRVIIAGAGPGGLLLQALLHHRNKTSSATSRIIYETTLIESRPNLGILNQDELQAHRSWMIGLGKSFKVCIDHRLFLASLTQTLTILFALGYSQSRLRGNPFRS